MFTPNSRPVFTPGISTSRFQTAPLPPVKH